MFRWRMILPCLGFFLTLALLSTTAQAQSKPFNISGAGIVEYIPLPGDPAANHCAVGNATMLGKYFADGWVQTDMFTSPTTANFSSAAPIVFTAANGDELHFDYVGAVELRDAGNGQSYTVWTAEFTPVIGASTGRFEKVIGGSFIMTATTGAFSVPGAGGDQDIPYSWEGNGHLEF